jgi:hypothetical protein
LKSNYKDMEKFLKVLGFVLLVSRVYIIYKLVILLYLTQSNPVEYPMDKLTWWGYLLIFDIWLQLVLPPIDENKEN